MRVERRGYRDYKEVISYRQDNIKNKHGTRQWRVGAIEMRRERNKADKVST